MTDYSSPVVIGVSSRLSVPVIDYKGVEVKCGVAAVEGKSSIKEKSRIAISPVTGYSVPISVGVNHAE